MKSIYLSGFSGAIDSNSLVGYETSLTSQVNVGDNFYVIAADSNGGERALKTFEDLHSGVIEKVYAAPTVPNWNYYGSGGHNLYLRVYRRIK
jgi:hypothetical protein